MTTDPLAVFAAEAVNTDDALRRRIASFVSNVLDEAEYLMENGNPKQKGDLISKLVPHLVKQMSEQAEDESIATMRAEMQAMYEEMRQASPHVQPPLLEPDIPVDEPAAPPLSTSPTSTRIRVKKK